MLALWQLGLHVSNILQEVVHRKRNLEPPDSVIRSCHLIEGFIKCSNKYKNYMLLSAEHPGSLAKLAVFSRHLLREFRFPELSLKPGHLLVEVLVLLGDLGQESAALLHQRKHLAEVLL